MKQQIEVVEGNQHIVTFTLFEAKQLKLVEGQRYNIVPQGVSEDGTKQFIFVPNKKGKCEVRRLDQ